MSLPNTRLQYVAAVAFLERRLTIAAFGAEVTALDGSVSHWDAIVALLVNPGRLAAMPVPEFMDRVTLQRP